MEAKLYVIPGSHPARTAAMMLERKGIPYKRVDLMPVISKGALRAVGLPRDHGPGAEDRRPEGPGDARDRARARPPAPRAAAVSGRSRTTRCGRVGRVVGRPDSATDRPPDPLELPAPRPIGARLLLRGSAARGACRPRREDGPAAGRPLGAAQRSHRRERPRRSRGAARDAAADRRLDRRRAARG